MADEKQAAAEEPAADEKPKKKLNLKALLMVGGCLAAQAVIVMVVLYFAGAANKEPQHAAAAEPQAEEAQETVEICVTPNTPNEKIKAINSKKGSVHYWVLKVYLQVRTADFERVKTKLVANENLIKQEISRIVADCEPFLLEGEADHATLRRQIRFALAGVLGKGTVNDVLISECITAEAN